MTSLRGVTLRRGTRADWDAARELAWKTFNEFDAVDYTPEGRQNFRKFLDDLTLLRLLGQGDYLLFVAILYGTTVGMLTLRDRVHISLLFVTGDCHRNGIGSALVELAAETVAAEYGGSFLTVNASHYAEPFYRKLGFVVTGSEQVQDGIRYTPMVLELE